MRLRALLVVCGVALSGCDSGPTHPTPASCTFNLSATSVTIGAAGGPGSISVSTGSQCSWTASTGASWITIASGRTGMGPGSIGFAFTSNFDAARQGIIEVRWPTPTAGQNVRVAQEGCDYGLYPLTFSVPAGGGNFGFDVYSFSTDEGYCGFVGPTGRGKCWWSAQSAASWITVLTKMPTNGEDRVVFRVAPNGSTTPRTASITVGNRTLYIGQAGI